MKYFKILKLKNLKAINLKIIILLYVSGCQKLPISENNSNKKTQLKEAGLNLELNNSNQNNIIQNQNLKINLRNPYTKHKSRNFSVFFNLKLNLTKEQFENNFNISYKVDGIDIGSIFQIYILSKGKYLSIRSGNSKYSKITTFIENENEDGIYNLDCKLVLENIIDKYKIFTLKIHNIQNDEEQYIIDIELDKFKGLQKKIKSKK
ncbi:MAG: hypothetical protein GY830_01980 [Bacteroidetes bacterium]|nr:hypothetical protein [Bacteroidota bacterium]